MVTTKSDQPFRVERVRRRVERWREQRGHPKSRMPDRLWTEAVAVARQDGLYRTARALRLDYGALRRHVEAAEAAGVRPTFVELASRPSGEYVIEIDGRHATVRLRVPGMRLSDLATLGRLLAGVES
jgi:hypothetical protein